MAPARSVAGGKTRRCGYSGVVHASRTTPCFRSAMQCIETPPSSMVSRARSAMSAWNLGDASSRSSTAATCLPAVPGRREWIVVFTAPSVRKQGLGAHHAWERPVQAFRMQCDSKL